MSVQPIPTTPTMREYLERAHAAQQAVNDLGMGPRTPPNAHDVEEAMRPYLGEVYELEQEARATASHPTALERAYRAALDHLLHLNGVTR